MTEEANTPVFDDDAMEFYPSDPAVIAVEDTLDTFLGAASVEAVIGEPVAHGDALIIPMAEVLSVAGFGMGSAFGKTSKQPDEEAADVKNAIGNSGGGAGGGKVFARPVGVIIASPEGVRVEPVIDVTKIALAALTTAGFMTAMLLRMASPGKAITRPHFE